MLAGLIPGILLPMVTMMVVWIITYRGTVGEFLQALKMMSILASVISLSAIPNLLLFFIFIWTNRIRSARGVIFATLIIAFVMLVFKYI